MFKNLISVIVVTYNCEKWVLAFINSILSQTYTNYEIVIVDNNSKDNTLEIFKNSNLKVKIISLENNIGFGVGNNIGSKHASGDLLLFLNVDTRFDPNFFFELQKYLHDEKLNLVGPRLLGYNGEDELNGKFLSIDVYGGVGSSTLPFYIEGSAIFINKIEHYFEKMLDEDITIENTY
jgi:GT2 family glycosyltransferase